MTRGDHFGQVAAEQQRVDDKHRDQRADAGRDEHRVERQREHVIADRPAGRMQPHRDALGERYRFRRGGLVGIIAPLDRLDDLVGQRAEHRHRHRAKQEPAEQDRDQRRQRGEQPAVERIARYSQRPAERQPQQRTDRGEDGERRQGRLGERAEQGGIAQLGERQGECAQRRHGRLVGGRALFGQPWSATGHLPICRRLPRQRANALPQPPHCSRSPL